MRRGKNWGIVFDCDGTLFPKKIGSLMKLVDDRALTPEAKGRTTKLRDFYLPFALDGTLTAQQERDWLIATVRIYTDFRITDDQLRTALFDARLRPGVADGLRDLHRAGVKLGVVSYGVAPLIQVALEINGVADLFEQIFAATMDKDDAGQYASYDGDTFVVPDDKGEWSRLFAVMNGVPDEQLLAVGDSGGDRHLGILKENRLGVLEKPEEADKLLRHMGDVVLVENDFTPATDWLRRKIGI